MGTGFSGEVIGGVFSAMPSDRLPSPQARAVFAADVRAALDGQDSVTEQVHVWLQFGQLD